MEMTLDGGQVLTLTPAEFYELVRESEIKDGTRGHRNVLASPTEAVQATVEHQKPKAGDLIKITGDGHVGRLHPHEYPVGTILVVRELTTPDDRVYAGIMGDSKMIHNSFYHVFSRIDEVEAPHVFEVGDIVRVTKDHSMSSRNKKGDIGEITTANSSGSFRIYVAARDDVTEGWCSSFGDNQKPDSFELVVAKKDRKDSEVQK